MTYTHMDNSKRGATFLAKNAPATVRGELIDLIRSNPNADKEVIFSKFQELVDDNPDYLEAIERYFFTNNYNSAREEIRQTEEESSISSSVSVIAKSMAQRIERQKRQELVKSAAKKFVNEIALLFLTMPNGKAMRYCTGIEMEKFGKGYARIAKRVGGKTVGEVLSEEEVRGLML